MLTVKPDPPLDVQVEVGPKEGTLLVTWLPVTLRPSGSSNGAPVAGYNIYVDGRTVAKVTGANGKVLFGKVNKLREPIGCKMNVSPHVQC